MSQSVLLKIGIQNVNMLSQRFANLSKYSSNIPKPSDKNLGPLLAPVAWQLYLGYVISSAV